MVSGFGVVLLCSVFFRNFNIVPELPLIVDEVRFLGASKIKLYIVILNSQHCYRFIIICMCVYCLLTHCQLCDIPQSVYVVN